MSPDSCDGGDDARSTWTDREIVLDLFPATHERLVPALRRHAIVDVGDGQAVVRNDEGRDVARLVAVTPSGNPTAELCCDLCQRSGTRRWVTVYRSEVPGSGGRRFRYLTACRDLRACEARRIDDTALLSILELNA